MDKISTFSLQEYEEELGEFMGDIPALERIRGELRNLLDQVDMGIREAQLARSGLTREEHEVQIQAVKKDRGHDVLRSLTALEKMNLVRIVMLAQHSAPDDPDKQMELLVEWLS